MKILLASLMCVVLGVTECLALKGGPVYPGAQANVVGTYAGVLNPAILGSNTLGIFSLAIPQTGLASGTVVLFTGERTFVGTVQGVGDPKKGTLKAAVQAIPVVMGGGQTVTTLNFHADGVMNAKIKNSSNNAFSFTATRLIGTAHVTTTNRNVSPPEKTNADFTVDGFKQSNTSG